MREGFVVLIEARRHADIALAHRPAFGVVAVDEACVAPALQHGRQFPSDVDRIAETGIHAERAGRRQLMHGVAGEPHAALAVAFGHQAAPAPDIDVDPLDRDIAAERSPQIGFAVDLVGRDIAGRVDHQPPYPVDRIDDAQIGPDAAAVDRNIEGAGLAAALRQQVGRAEEHVDGIADDALTGERDAEAAPHQAGGAVAADEIVGGDRVTRAVGEVGDFGGHALAVLRKGFQPMPVIEAHARERARPLRQHGVEPDLRAGLQAVGARRLRRLVVARRADHAAEFMAEQRGDEDRVERVIARKRAVHHLVRDPPATAEFHRAGVHLVHLRRGDAAVALLDQAAGDAAPAEFGGERQADGTAADDEDRGVCLHDGMGSQSCRAGMHCPAPAGNEFVG